MSNSKTKNDKSSEKEDNPCWKGYEPIGMKEKDGKQVPNCVPKDEKGTQKAKKKS